jgi:uncharacterized protein YecE (DUF72 family)
MLCQRRATFKIADGTFECALTLSTQAGHLLHYRMALTRLYLGTGGFSNEDWVGIFYPPELKKTQWLEFYAQHFNAVEINSTFYAVPGQKQMANMLERTERNVMFCAKLHQSFTHDLSATSESASKYLYTMHPLIAGERFGAVLAQFPFKFKNTTESRAYLSQLAEWFQGVPVAVEFRHSSWDKEPVYQFLADLGLHAVSVDLPRLEGLPAPMLKRSSFVYIRLHGRNSGNWFEGKDAAERHDYLYTNDELEPWVRTLHASGVRNAYVFFENTTRGQGLENARMFKKLWEAQAGLERGS